MDVSTSVKPCCFARRLAESEVILNLPGVGQFINRVPLVCDFDQRCDGGAGGRKIDGVGAASSVYRGDGEAYGAVGGNGRRRRRNP